MLEDLQRLLLLSADLDKPKVERAPRADTKKNRLALAEACRLRSIEPLRRLLDLGAPVNFLIEEKFNGTFDRSLLGICADNGWTSGTRALIEAGADERLIPEFSGKIKIQGTDTRLPRFAQTAADRGHSDVFSLSIPLHTRADLHEALAHCRHPGVFMAARAAGISDLVSSKAKMSLLLESLDGIDPSCDPAGSSTLCFDALFAELAPEPDVDLANTLWVRALSLGSPGAIQGLAARHIAPLMGWTVSVNLSAHLSARGAPSSLASSKLSNPGFYSYESWEWKPQAEKTVTLGLASAAAALSTCRDRPHALRALCAIEPLRRELFASDLGRHYLARIVDVDTHKRLSRLGMDLSIVRSDDGQNPLHWAARTKQPKHIIESLARVCASWIDQLDGAGKRPIDLLVEPERKQSISVIFDQIGMREALSGRRGSKAPATRRRL